jgi:hypothetical protein
MRHDAMIFNPSFLLLLLPTLAVGLTRAECPADCVCMWKNGKETTECINKVKQ